MSRNLVHTCSRDKEGRVVWNCLFLPELKFKFFDYFFFESFSCSPAGVRSAAAPLCPAGTGDAEWRWLNLVMGLHMGF